jgi:hypothetical protein
LIGISFEAMAIAEVGDSEAELSDSPAVITEIVATTATQTHKSKKTETMPTIQVVFLSFMDYPISFNLF